MIEERNLPNVLEAVLVEAGGKVHLDQLQSLFKEKYDTDLPYDTSRGGGTFKDYLLNKFSNICRVQQDAEGHFVVKMRQLPSISPIASIKSPQQEHFSRFEAKPLHGLNRPGQSNNSNIRHADQQHSLKRNPMKNSSSPFQSRGNDLFKSKEYQVDRNAETSIAELEQKLAEECAKRQINVPTFKFITRGREPKETFCVAIWEDDLDKVQSHPDIFATEDAAKASVIRKVLQRIDAIAEKSTSSFLDAQTKANTVNGQEESSLWEPSASVHSSPEAQSRPFLQATAVPRSSNELDERNDGQAGCDESFTQNAANRVESDENHAEVGNTEYDDDDLDQINDFTLPELENQPTTESSEKCPQPPSQETSLANRTSNDLAPQINMQEPSSRGFLVHVSEDRSLVVQVKGLGLEKWERQSYAYNPHSPVQQIVPFRWYLVEIFYKTKDSVLDRAMCLSEEGPVYDAQGYVELAFPDNGYSNFVDPKHVFEASNYEEVDRLPPQSVQVHAAGFTGSSAIDYIQLTHSANHEVLFLPANNSDCFLSNCAENVPHVYIYDLVSKRILG